MNSIKIAFATLFAAFAFQASAKTEVKNLQATSNQPGRISVQIPAQSIFQYTPVILCDSQYFQMSHHSSFYRNGLLTADFNYQTYGPSLGTWCSLYFVNDDMEQFDFSMGMALRASERSFRFVIQ
ncbi:MAG: hypothetical protein GW917_01205 [Bdellovibrionales bacterium]|nr:hypothetical protein [Bdellovibrionales bacterium]